jgi:hypothetical protein
MRFRSLISQIGKPVDASEALANRTSKWVAKHFGVSRRTAQRWKAGTQQPGKRVGGSERVMDSANSGTRRKVAADALRGASAVNAGRVSVRYPGGRAGGKTRNLGVVQLDERARERMAEAADALESGDLDRAERLVSDAVLNSNGKNYGPLEIDDYPPGFHLI